MSPARRRALVLAGAAALALAIGACGRKGPPVAPETRIPVPVSDLDGVVRSAGIDLTWSAPRRRVDNTRLPDPGVARIFRLEDAGQGEPRAAMLADGRIAGYTEIGTIRVSDPAARQAQSGRLTFNDRGLALGRRYTYVVVTTDPEGRTSAPSRRLTLAYVAAPEPPQDLTAAPGEREVRLSWRPPARLTDGGPATDVPLAYEVLRSAAPDGPAAVVSRTEPGVTSTTDRGLQDDRTYYYAVRAVRQQGAAVVEGEATPRIAATPTDITPPKPAADLVAIASERTVRLAWTPSPDSDVSGYVVYRADSTGPFTRVGSVRAPATTFTDRDVPAGAYRYAVTAQDASTRANESARSNEVRITVP